MVVPILIRRIIIPLKLENTFLILLDWVGLGWELCRSMMIWVSLLTTSSSSISSSTCSSSWFGAFVGKIVVMYTCTTSLVVVPVFFSNPSTIHTVSLILPFIIYLPYTLLIINHLNDKERSIHNSKYSTVGYRIQRDGVVEG